MGKVARDAAVVTFEALREEGWPPGFCELAASLLGAAVERTTGEEAEALARLMAEGPRQAA